MLNEKTRYWFSICMILIGITIVFIGFREQIQGSEDMRNSIDSDTDKEFASELDRGYERAKIGGYIFAFGMGLLWGGIFGTAYILYNKNKKEKIAIS